MFSFKQALPHGLSLRPANASDNAFLEKLYRSTREDLYMLDADTDFIETLVEQQQQAQSVGYGDSFPNAMYFIIEKLNESVGQIVIDFGTNEVRVVDISLISAARNKGYGTALIQMLQYACESVNAPLRLTVHKHNMSARHLYHHLGFQIDECGEASDVLAWYPGQGQGQTVNRQASL